VYSVLSHAKPLIQASRPKRVVLAPEGVQEEGEPPATSWCKGVEKGIVKPSTMSEGPKQRKKRKRMEGGQVQPPPLFHPRRIYVLPFPWVGASVLRARI